jgi:hypothetical protein
VVLTIFFLNIGSSLITIPLTTNVDNEKVIPKLRGKKVELLPQLKSPKPEITIDNIGQSSTSSSDIELSRIKFGIEGGEENDVDNNLSNVDSSDDIGSEVDFSNAQGTTNDSQFMQLQEVSPTPPTITIDSISTFNAASSIINFNHTVSGTNRLLLVYIHTNIGSVVNSVNYDGSSLNLVQRTESFAKPPAGPSIEIWQQINPNPGFANGSVTLAASDDVAVTIVSYTGVDQINPIDGLVNQTVQTDNSSITVASRTGDLVQDAFVSISTGLPTEGVLQKSRWRVEMGTTDRWGAGSTQTGASSVTFNWETTLLKDSVHIGFNIRRANSPYELDLEYQWTSAEYRREFEELAIFAGVLGVEDLRVDIWDGSGSWDPLIPILAPKWNNVSITSYLTSPTLTIRFKGTEELNDLSLDTWNIDLMLIVMSAENVAPIAESLSLTPDPLISNDTLHLSYNFTDPNNDTESGTEIRWYTWNTTGEQWDLLPAYNDEESILSSALIKGHIWRATVKPSDGIEFGNVSTSANITVQNALPTITSPDIMPSNPKICVGRIINKIFSIFLWRHR